MEPKEFTQKNIQNLMKKARKFQSKVEELKKRIQIENSEEKYITLSNKSVYLDKLIQEADRERAELFNYKPVTLDILNPQPNNLLDIIKQLKAENRELNLISTSNDRAIKQRHESIYKYRDNIKKLKSVKKKSPSKSLDFASIMQSISEREFERILNEQDYLKHAKELEEMICKKQEDVASLKETLKKKDRECRVSVVNIRNLSTRNLYIRNRLITNNHKSLS